MLVRRDSEEVCRGVPTCFVRCLAFADFSIITGHGKGSMPAARYFNYYKLYRNIRGAEKIKNLLIFLQIGRSQGKKRKISKDEKSSASYWSY